MNAEQVNQLIQAALAKYSNNIRYNVNAVPQQKLNSLNISVTPTQVLTYVGKISFSFVSGISFSTLPTGWTIDWQGGGIFVLTHNLNSELYSVVATASNAGTSFPVVSTTEGDTTVTFAWVDSKTQIATDTDFDFSLTIVNNKKTTFPTYTSPQ